MSNFMDNLRQLLYVVCVTGILTAFCYMIRWAVCTAFGWDWLLHDEEDGDDE